jgi:NhaP-type Na+/H+ or K+/H+ antiporter
MDGYMLMLTLVGLAAFGMAWMPAMTARTGISYSILYVFAGIILYSLFPSLLPDPNPVVHNSLTMHGSELVVIISLMGTGIKIDRRFSVKNWSSPLRLIFIAMLLSILAATILAREILAWDTATALLLAAAFAPTDPVLASDVQVGPPNAGKKSETKFALTAEAGLNDGTAFPFVWLAIILGVHAAGGENKIIEWFSYYLLYKIAAGLLIGYALGKAVGYIVFRLTKKISFLDTSDGFLAISLTLIVYGITELLHGYGFIAVFICAYNLRHYEKEHDYHDELHSFTDQAERLLVAVLLILFGGSLATGILNPLNWQLVSFSLLFLFVVRPVTAYLSLLSTGMHLKEKLAISFFGIRGMGSIFYLAFAFSQFHFQHQKEIWAVAAFTILISVIIHGITATPIMRHLKDNIEEGKVPE